MLALTDVKPGCECMVKWFFADRDIEENMRCLGIGQGSRLQVVKVERTFDYCSGEWETDCIV